MHDKNAYFKLVFPDVDANHNMPIEVEIHARHDGTFVRMTPTITESEFDEFINLLIDELEQIRHDGKKKFSLLKDKFRK